MGKDYLSGAYHRLVVMFFLGTASLFSEHAQVDAIEPYNTTNPYRDSWCPDAMCYNSPTCSPCNRRFLFIVATGRSGSTTLLTMFDMLPHVRLTGENQNVLHIASMIKKALSRNYEKDELYGAWKHYKMEKQALACPVQQIIEAVNTAPREVMMKLHENETLRLEEQRKILGAKMIRISRGDWSPSEAANFFMENFPCSRIIVNYRSDTEAQLKSRMKYFYNTAVKDKTLITEENQFLMRFADVLGNRRAKLIDLTQWSSNVTILNDVVSWLGFHGCYFQDIIHENKDGYHLYKGKSVFQCD